VESLFVVQFGTGEVTGDKLHQFRGQLPRDFAEGRYGRALASYAQGVLLRNQGLGSARPSAEFKECYTEAGSVLSRYDRPLARLVCGVACFALNDFDSIWRGTGWERLDRVLRAINRTAVSSPNGVGASVGIRNPVRCPSDRGTDRIIELSENLAGWTTWREFDIQHRKPTIVESLDPFDQVKARALYAVTALRLGTADHCKQMLEDLLGDSTFGSWAQKQLLTIEAPDARFQFDQ
jgi:hypothetical protein